jgi:lipopolysaccharide export system protein LptA
MKSTRWLLLVAILAILGGVGATYRLQKKFLAEQAPRQPEKLSPDLKSLAQDWVWTQSEGDRAKVTIRARSFRQVKDSGITELEQVQLQVFSREENTYNLIKSAHAQFTQSERRMYSDGEVEITLRVPVEGTPKRTLVSIRTSGVTYEYATGMASTGRAASFVFENGTGKAVGASYNPNDKLLRLYHDVVVDWKAPGPRAKPMKLEAGELSYQEAKSKIWLAPWARVTRENSVIESADAVITLEDGAIRMVEASKGHGTDRYPKRQLEYSADNLSVNFSDQGVVEKVAGEPNARLVNTSEGSVTTVTANRLDLEFGDATGESVLSKALANGDTVVESKPLPAAGRQLPETRILRSAVVEVKMRPDGKEIEGVTTQSPGTLEFLPNRPAQRRRLLTGERMWIAYGPQNHIQSFRAEQATTLTEPTAEERARKKAPSKTSSKTLTAEFDPKTSQMTRMEQTEDFIYTEGDRNARARHAVLESQQNLITLETGAKMWDTTGSTFADRIRLDQRTNNFTAEGHVTSSRLPEKKKPNSDLLSGDEPLQAVAESMNSSNRNQVVQYRGKVVLWQGANRLQAERVDIDREKHRLQATGGVVTQFLDEQKEDAKSKTPVKPVFTIVRAAELVYTEADRLAHYKGGVTLTRPGLSVQGGELRSFLNESGADSRMDHAFADGKVRIVQQTLNRSRTGTGEHAEYYTADQKIILRGGEPQLADALRGITRGTELTYFADDDKLLVDGAPDRPAASAIRPKTK